MAVPTYLTRDPSINQTRVVEAVQTSSGFASSNQIVATGPDGLIDPSFLPAAAPAPGPSGSTFVYRFPVPTTDVQIVHNLGRIPSVTVLDSAGELCVGSVTYIDNNTIDLHFSAPFAGSAYLN